MRKDWSEGNVLHSFSAVLAPGGLGGRGSFVGLIIAQMAASQRDEYVFQTDVPRCQADQRALLAVELGQSKGRGCAVRLGDGQRVSIIPRPERQVPSRGLGTIRLPGLPRRPGDFERELDDMVPSPGGRSASAGDPWAMMLPPWSIIGATSLIARSARLRPCSASSERRCSHRGRAGRESPPQSCRREFAGPVLSLVRPEREPRGRPLTRSPPPTSAAGRRRAAR